MPADPRGWGDFAELAQTQGVVAAVERRARGRPVARVGVRVGARLRVVADAFQQSFELVAAEGAAADAVTELTVVPAQGRCRDCGTDFETVDAIPACPDCGGVAVDASGGDELVVTWIRYRDGSAAAPTVCPG